MEICIRESKLQGIGLPPGTLGGLAGSHISKPPRLRVMSYGVDGCSELDTTKLNDALARIGEKSVTWIQVIGISEVSFIQEIGQRMNIHPLALEDVATTWGRTKLQDYGDQLFIVAKAAVVDKSRKKLNLEQISIVVGGNYVVSFQESESTLFDAVEGRILDASRMIRKQNTGYLLYALLDTLVDHLLLAIDLSEEETIELEDGVLDKKEELNIEHIYRYKRAVLVLSRIATPVQELAHRLELIDNQLIPDTLDYYYRDLAEHATRAAERITHTRAVLQNLQEYYHMEGDYRNNNVMRVLTVVATTFIPLTFVCGVYGMNFNTADGPWSMPELRSPYGYPIVMASMAVYAVITLIFFRRKKWL